MLGIAILVAFSLGLTLFMRLDFSRSPRRLPANLGHWEVVNAPLVGGDLVSERRWLLVEGTGLLRHRLVEQRRTRRSSDGEVVSVEPERVVERWFSV